ncbi:hypothetical protein [Deinococcus sp. QL22]|uniref:hypothetical protein n=1 Tax=Deinococcus sp. QL22 TaxID=2939437 RepID=UPI0020176FA9|nr:hypothetical protein [Deinococcus sp. QL22]UQN09158.1 hypothetical protein M1R55_24265 [Deinococcus sp. QL22]
MTEPLLPDWLRALLAERYPRPPHPVTTVSMAWQSLVLRVPTPVPADGCLSVPLSALLFTPLPLPPGKQGGASLQRLTHSGVAAKVLEMERP